MKMTEKQIAAALKEYGYQPEIAGEAAFSQAVKTIATAQEKHRGILVNGECGVGKTTFCDAAALILAEGNSIYPVYLSDHESAMNLTRSDELTRALGGFVSLDDMGAENLYNDYGIRRDYVGEFISAYHGAWSSIKWGPVMVVSTNLSASKLLARYDSRVVERLMQITVAWTMPGESKRDFVTVGEFK